MRSDTSAKQKTLDPLSIDALAASAVRIRDMSLKEKEAVVDEIAILQPNLLALVFVLNSLEVPIQKVDQVLHILLVLYDAFKRSMPEGIPMISEDTMEAVDKNQMALLRLMDAEEPEEAARLCRLATTSHPEINAFAYANGTLRDAGMYDAKKQDEFYCVRAVRNLVDVFSRTRRS